MNEASAVETRWKPAQPRRNGSAGDQSQGNSGGSGGVGGSLGSAEALLFYF